MQNSVLKYITIIVLIMIVPLIICACKNRENVDYLKDRYNYNESVQDSILGQQLQVPYACYQELNADVSGVKSIIIDDVDIQVPDGDRMDIVYCETADYEGGFIQNLLEGFCNSNTPIYQYPEDEDIITSKLLEETIALHERWLKGARDAGNAEGIAEMEKDIKRLKSLRSTTIEEYPVAKSFTEEQTYIVANENSEYITQTNRILPNQYLYISIKRMPVFLKKEYTGDEENVAFESEVEDFSGVGRESNICSISVEDAADKAGAIMEQCGLKDMILTDIGDIMWFYSVATGYLTGESLPGQYDGYVFRYVRSVNGKALYSPSLYSLDNIAGNIDEGIYGNMNASYDQISVFIDDVGVVKLEGTYRLSETDRDKNVDLLTFDEAVEALSKGIGDYYMKYPTSYSKICFNDVRLTYYAVSDGKGDFKIIPVWVFAEASENVNGDKTEISENSPVQLVIVNAVDGSIVDIPQELGMFLTE